MRLVKSEEISVKGGHCYLVDMNPPRKSKPGKIRPVIVVQSSDTLMAGSPGVVIVPLTTNLLDENILRARTSKEEIPNLEKISDILLDQIHTIDRSLFLKELGPISPHLLEKIKKGVGFLLNF